MTNISVHKKLVYPPELIEKLAEVIKKHGKVNENFHENMVNCHELQTALNPVLKSRSEQLQIPDTVSIEELMRKAAAGLRETVMTVELDSLVESLINLCIDKQSKIVAAMFNQK